MARPDASLLDPARYPFSCLLEPRFGDLDVNQHINNVAMAGLVEEARVRFHRATGLMEALEGLTVMVAALNIAFVGQTFYPDPLEARVALAGAGRTSYRLAILLLQRGLPVVQAETVLVCMDGSGPVALPQSWLAGLGPWNLKP